MNAVAPRRIQLRRTKGWRKPEGAIVVSRPTRYGNPFQTVREDAQWAVDQYREFITAPEYREVLNRGYYYPNRGVLGPDLTALRGHDLACWCPLDQPCHADVLLEIANAEASGA